MHAMERKSRFSRSSIPSPTTRVPSPTTRVPSPSPTASAAKPAKPAKPATVASAALSPEMVTAVSMNLMVRPELKEAGIDLAAVMAQLHNEGQAVASGDLEQLRRTLSTQVAMLNQMFHTLFQLAYTGSLTHDLIERYLRLALKAQGQSAHTMQLLARLSPEPAREDKNEPPAPAKAPAPAVMTTPPRRFSAPLPVLNFNRKKEDVLEGSPNRPREGAGAGSALHGLSAPAGV